LSLSTATAAAAAAVNHSSIDVIGAPFTRHCGRLIDAHTHTHRRTHHHSIADDADDDANAVISVVIGWSFSIIAGCDSV